MSEAQKAVLLEHLRNIVIYDADDRESDDIEVFRAAIAMLESDEIAALRADLARVAEERDVWKKRAETGDALSLAIAESTLLRERMEAAEKERDEVRAKVAGLEAARPNSAEWNSLEAVQCFYAAEGADMITSNDVLLWMRRYAEALGVRS